MEIIGFIVFGLIVGVLARLIVPGKQRLSIGVTLLLGVVGSIVGGVIAAEVGTGNMFELNFLGTVLAVLTAALLIALVDGPHTRRRRTRSRSTRRRRSFV